MTNEVEKNYPFKSEESHTWLKTLLREMVITITFTKVDGTLRVIDATLKPELLPVVEQKEVDNTKPPKKQSEATVRVLDIEINEWRSIRWDSINALRFGL